MHDESHWSVDKRIPLALILTIFLQTAGFSYWMGQLSTRVDQTERTVIGGSGNGDRLTKLEVKLESIGDQLRRVETQLTTFQK